MFESGKNDFIGKKAYEMAYALFRISGKISDRSFADTLHNQAIMLLHNSAKENYAEATKDIDAIGYFIKLGIDFDYINLFNGDVLLKELGYLNTAITESGNPAINEHETSLAGIFSKREVEVSTPVTAKGQIFDSESVNAPGVSNVIKSGIRQSAILDRIRQSGNCRIRDLQEILPDLSERTIRYDLQSLVEQGLIEKVGVGGPAVFYRIRQNAEVPER